MNTDCKKLSVSKFRRGSATLSLLWLLVCGSFAAYFCWAAAGTAAPGRNTVTAQHVASAAPAAYLTKRIEDVKAGEQVMAYDPATNQWSARAVVRPLKHEYDGEVVTIRAAGETIDATANHPFWVVSGKDIEGRPAAHDVPEAERQTAAGHARGRWVEAGHLRPGDLLILRDGQTAAVEELAVRWARLEVYNLEVADLHTYAVGARGIVVHNKSPGELGGGAGTPPEGGPFVYRGLAKGEDPTDGLTARAPGAGNNELSHVAGKRDSQWISTTKDEAAAVGKYGENGAVRIDLSKVDSEVSDVSGGIPNGGRMSNWAKRDQEVLIKDRVPPEAVERIK